MSHLKILNLLPKSLWKLCLTFSMLKHNILDIFMLKSNHLKHLNYLYYVLRNLTVCVYRERHLLPRNTSHGLMVPLHLMKFLFNSTSWYILHECKPTLFSVRQPVFLFWYDSFSLLQIPLIFHHAAQYHRSRCLQRGLAKGGNLNLDGATWSLPRGCPMGNLNFSGVV